MRLRDELVTVLAGEQSWSGTLPAVTPTVGPAELLTDPGLEVWDSATVPHAPWATNVVPTSSVNREDVVFHGGVHAARCDIDATAHIANLSQQVTRPAGSWLQFSVWARANADTPGFSINTSLQAGAALTLSTTYTQYVQMYKFGAANEALTLVRGAGSTSHFLYFDDVSAQQLTQSTLYTTRVMQFVNGIFTCQPVRALGTQAGIIHYADANNLVIVTLDGAGNIKVDKLVGGTWQANVSTNAKAYGVSQVLSVQRSGAGATALYTVKYNGAPVGAANSITDTVFDTAKRWGVFSTYAPNTFGTCTWAGPH